MEMNLQQGGVLVAILGTLIMHFGFSDVCANQLIQFTPVVAGSVMSYIHQLQAGHITKLGNKVV